MDLTSADLDSLSKRDLERLCRKHDLRLYGLKSQLVVRLRAHRTTLLSGDSGVPPASSTSDKPRSSATAVLSPPPSLSPVMTSTPSAPRRDSDRDPAESSAFTPEQQAHIERLIASHIASAGTGAGPSTSTPPSTVPASATLATANHGGVGESTIIKCKKYISVWSAINAKEGRQVQHLAPACCIYILPAIASAADHRLRAKHHAGVGAYASC